MEAITRENFSFSKDYEKLIFQLAVFLLPTAISVSILLLLIVSLKNIVKNRNLILKDSWNKYLLISSFLLTISSIWNYFDQDLVTIYSLNAKNSSYFIGLLNWIPLFILFIGCQPYLKSSDQRKEFALILISGTFPVILMGIFQGFFGIYGPFEFLFGLIVWFQRPIDSFTDITSIFNNPNYYGSWLNIIWPFCLASSINYSKSVIAKIVKLFFLILTPLSIVLTSSRAALTGLIFSSSFFFGKRKIKYILLILGFCTLLILAINDAIFGLIIQSFLRKFIPIGLWINFNPSSYTNLEISRVEIWHFTLQKIAERPLWGFGSSTFPEIFKPFSGLWRGHTHNLPLELALSFGLPAALSVIIPVILIPMLKLKKILGIFRNYFEKNIFDYAFLISFFFIILNHLVDVSYFDGRISIASWLLLAGIKKIEIRNND